MLLKVCGMKYEGNIRALIEHQPDYLGFIMYPFSKRYVEEVHIEYISQLEFPNKTAVFVNATLEELLPILQNGNFSHVQLHGDESPEFCKELQTKYSGKIIKAFGVHEGFDFQETRPYQALVDFFLFDTKGKEYGGNGQVFDWEILKKYDQSKPFFLSGGIGPENIGALLEYISQNKFNLHAIDVNSRFELEPGLKDIQKIKILMQELEANS